MNALFPILHNAVYTKFCTLSTWTTQNFNSPNDPELNGVSFSDANTGVAVGWGGTVLRTTDAGNNWIDQSIDSDYVLLGICFVDSNRFLIVGDKRKVFYFENGSWIRSTLLPTFIIDDLNDISILDKDTAIVVGDNGTILRSLERNWFNWNRQQSGTLNNLHGVFFRECPDFCVNG